MNDVDEERSKYLPVMAEAVLQLEPSGCSSRATSEEYDDDDEDDFRSTSSTVEVTLPMKMFANRKSSLCKRDVDIARYDRICTLGAGTFGRVLLVRHQETKDYFALKVMSIREIVASNQVDHVHSERKILENIDHPFITHLYWAYHDNKCLYMLFNYLPGGELFSYLRCEGSFTNETAKFYATEIVLALEYLHSRTIVFRDLKPENLLLDAEGHVVLIDFGFAKIINERTWTMCGTAEYLSPEVIEGRGHNKAVDWWSLGVLIYEMLAGRPPFRADTTFLTYQVILACKPKFPKFFDRVGKDLVRKLLVVDRTKRLGNMKGHAQDVKNHKWFRNVDWEEAYNRSLTPPIIPKVNYEGDSGNFDEYDEEEFSDVETAASWDLEQFSDW